MGSVFDAQSIGEPSDLGIHWRTHPTLVSIGEHIRLWYPLENPSDLIDIIRIVLYKYPKLNPPNFF
jgi:hypothetical protein